MIQVSWAIFRFISGYALAGLFIVVESWCSEGADSQYRGRILAIYLFIYYLTQASGQFLINISFSTVLLAFCVVSILASLSILPVCPTRFEMPKREMVDLASPWTLFKKVPLGIWAAFVSGAILGGIYTIYPLFLTQSAAKDGMVAYVMFTTIIGGVLLQFPIGKISDMIDRRKVLLILMIATIVISVFIAIFHGAVW